jgi:branched-chain amino acid transport system ATP-binding protein
LGALKDNPYPTLTGWSFLVNGKTPVEQNQEALLKTKDLTKHFGSLTAVNGISFTLYPGEKRAIIGPNGAGKTTFFGLLSGRLAPDKGQIFFKGNEITRHSMSKRSKGGIAASFQITNVFPNLSTFENIRIAAQSRTRFHNPFIRVEGLKETHERAEQIIHLIALDHESRTLAFNLSHGDQRKLEVGIALATDPILLLLDEPTAGMSVEETGETIRLIKEIAEVRHLTLVIVEHDMKVVMELADVISVLHYGEILAEGSPDVIRKNEKVQDIYLRGA